MAQELQNKPRFEVELDPALAEADKKQEEKSEKKFEKLNKEINKEFKVETGNDGKEIDNADNHLFMDEKQEEAHNEELAKAEETKQQEKEAGEKRWEEYKENNPALYDKNSLEYKHRQEDMAFNKKYYPDALG